MKRRDFLQSSAALSTVAGLSGALSAASMSHAVAEGTPAEDTPIVYFTKEITPEKLVELYEKLGRKLADKVAVKVHSGEPNGKHFIQPEFMKPLVDSVQGTIVECNTAYEGRRFRTADHWKVIEEHGFKKIAPVDILDEDGELELPVAHGNQIQTNYVGSHLSRYASILVLSHFKGHLMGGFGGALKNLSIGLASGHGKAIIHGAGDPEHLWDCEQDRFLEAMADACSSVVDHFPGNLVYLNVMKDLSIDCDCDSNPHAPEMADIGMLASLDPVALDQACVDQVYQSEDTGKASLIHRMEEKHAIHILEAAEGLKLGSRKYRLVNC